MGKRHDRTGRRPPRTPEAIPATFGAGDALAVLGSARPSLAADPPRPAPPLAAAPPARTADEVYAAIYWRTRDLLALARASGLVAQAVATAQRVAEDAWAAQRPQVEARGKSFDCAKGCGWCCHQQVAISPAEAVAIVRYLEKALDPEHRAAIVARVRATDARTRGLSAMARRETKLPCPFLEDGACAIHPARPMRCRGFFSRDVGLCRLTFDAPRRGVDHPRWRKEDVAPLEPTRLFDAALRAFATALHESGLANDTLELVAAVRIAIDQPATIDAWTRGEPAFASARLPARDAVPGAPTP